MLAFITALLVTQSGLAIPRPRPLSPSEEAKTFQVQNGFRMELVASEPLVVDPVAIAYDEDGRAYVAEMTDYPYTDKKNYKPGRERLTDRPIGRVRLLVDDDGDGRFDRSTVFTEGLSWPTGVACWKQGVFVVATPDVYYLKDTDGDGRADVRKTVMTGFRKVSPDLAINNPVWGLDHKIYIAGGGNGGDVRVLDAPGSNFRHGNNDVALDPVTGRVEIESGGGQFGNGFDDWGNRFTCNNRNPARHVIFPRRYLARNPWLPLGSPVHDVTEAGDQLPVFRISPPEPWRALRADRFKDEVHRKRIPRSELVDAGYITSSAGLTVYRSTAYPRALHGSMFVTESASNVVIHLALERDGVTFRARRSRAKTEFLSSTDNWFRPVNLTHAPDGTLHVLDMYREVIEDPCCIPDDIAQAIDFENGRDRGRIWRLEPPAFKAPPPRRLGRATTAELVATLESPNVWARDTAHRLIFERQDRAAAEPLRRLLRESRAPLARLHALWSLEGLAAVDENDLARALGDKAPGVREHAVRISEARLDRSDVLLSKVLSLAADSEARVRFQVALSSGGVDPVKARGALALIARRDAADEWMRTAVLAARPDGAGGLLHALVADRRFVARAPAAAWIRALASIVGSRSDDEEIARTLASSPGDDRFAGEIHSALLLGLGEGLRRRQRGLAPFFASPAVRVGAPLARLWAQAASVALDTRRSSGERERAARLLGHKPPAESRRVLEDLLAPGHPPGVQVAAVSALAEAPDAAVSDLLVSRFSAFTPQLKAEVVEVLLARPERTRHFLAAVERGQIPASQVGTARRVALLTHKDAEIQAKAKRLFGDASTRGEIVARYQGSVAAKGDPTRGEVIYRATCSACHRMGSQGHDVGPNLTTVRQWSPHQLLLNILDPNREVTPNFAEYVLELKDGQMVSGIISEETAGAITLKRAGDVRQTILRQQIDRMSSSGLSLMPEGLEAAIPPAAMADLIAFLTKG